MTSADAARRWRSARPSAVLRSRAMLRLLRLTNAKAARRASSTGGSGVSILTTSAPMSARSIVQNSPGATRTSSRILIPSRALTRDRSWRAGPASTIEAGRRGVRVVRHDEFRRGEQLSAARVVEVQVRQHDQVDVGGLEPDRVEPVHEQIRVLEARHRVVPEEPRDRARRHAGVEEDRAVRRLDQVAGDGDRNPLGRPLAEEEARALEPEVAVLKRVERGDGHGAEYESGRSLDARPAISNTYGRSTSALCLGTPRYSQANRSSDTDGGLRRAGSHRRIATTFMCPGRDASEVVPRVGLIERLVAEREVGNDVLEQCV